MITVINFTTESQWCTINQSMALVARIFANFGCFKLSIAAMAQGTIVVTYKSRVSQFSLTHLTAEALGMPARIHCFNNATNYDVTAFIAVRSKENSEIFFAVLASFEFIENSILKWSEALSATKT